MPFYAVSNGRVVGVFNSWTTCKKNVIGFKGAKFKKFDTEKEAFEFIDTASRLNINLTKDAVVNIETVRKHSDEDNNDVEYVYTDGGCINNGKPNASAGIGIYFGDDDIRNVSRRIVGKQTNNVAELMAIVEACRIVCDNEPTKIITDSTYSIKCVTTYGERCSRQKWKKQIPNMELVREAYNLFSSLDHISIEYVEAHTGKNDRHSLGNAAADRLANGAAKMKLV